MLTERTIQKAGQVMGKSERSEESDPTRIAIIGVGTMGSTIAVMFAQHGFHVVVTDLNESATEDGVSRVHQRISQSLPGAVQSFVRARISSANNIASAVNGADLVIEATSEQLEVKKSVLAHAASALSDTAILSTNTSSFPIDLLAQSMPTDVAPRFIGIHFFNPADLVPGVEVISHRTTSDEVVATCMDLLRKINKKPSSIRSSAGFVANRLQLALFLEALSCVDEGLATPMQVDAIVSTTFGFRLPAYGPFQVADMAGLDVYAGILGVLEGEFGSRFTMPTSLRTLVSSGLFGLKAGEGFYVYDSEMISEIVRRRDNLYRLIAETLDRVNESCSPVE